MPDDVNFTALARYAVVEQSIGATNLWLSELEVFADVGKAAIVALSPIQHKLLAIAKQPCFFRNFPVLASGTTLVSADLNPDSLVCLFVLQRLKRQTISLGKHFIVAVMIQLW